MNPMERNGPAGLLPLLLVFLCFTLPNSVNSQAKNHTLKALGVPGMIPGTVPAVVPASVPASVRVRIRGMTVTQLVPGNVPALVPGVAPAYVPVPSVIPATVPGLVTVPSVNLVPAPAVATVPGMVPISLPNGNGQLGSVLFQFYRFYFFCTRGQATSYGLSEIRFYGPSAVGPGLPIQPLSAIGGGSGVLPSPDNAPSQLRDGSLVTDWIVSDVAEATVVTFDFGTRVSAMSYQLYTAAGVPTVDDPACWDLFGTNDLVTETLLDSRSDTLLPLDRQSASTLFVLTGLPVVAVPRSVPPAPWIPMTPPKKDGGDSNRVGLIVGLTVGGMLLFAILMALLARLMSSYGDPYQQRVPRPNPSMVGNFPINANEMSSTPFPYGEFGQGGGIGVPVGYGMATPWNPVLPPNGAYVGTIAHALGPATVGTPVKYHP